MVIFLYFFIFSSRKKYLNKIKFPMYIEPSKNASKIPKIVIFFAFCFSFSNILSVLRIIHKFINKSSIKIKYFIGVSLNFH